MNPKPFPNQEFPHLRKLCIAVFKCFSKKNLLLSSAERRPAIAAARPLEAKYQDEFYRAFTSLLGNGVGISSEWSRDNRGRFDFRILGPKWGVQLLRDGDQLKDHYDRFLPGGKYYSWIESGLISDWLVIDCRCSTPEEYSKFTSLLHLWVTPLIIISATWTESVACCVCKGLFDAPHFRCRQPRNYVRSLLDGLITKRRRAMFLTIDCFVEKQVAGGQIISYKLSYRALDNLFVGCRKSSKFVLLVILLKYDTFLLRMADLMAILALNSRIDQHPGMLKGIQEAMRY